MKDIFIDNNIASKFSNPQDKEYIKLTQWLLHFDATDLENKHNYAHLIVSNKLLAEYYRSSLNALSNTAIPIIIDKLIKDGRLIKISNNQIKEFKEAHFSKKVEKKLTCNNEDREHIPVVLLSHRKYAISYDDNFIHDIINFPGFVVSAAKRPEHIPYSK
jgi:hypothetical protein